MEGRPEEGVGCTIGAEGVSPENCYAHTCELFEPHRCAGAWDQLGSPRDLLYKIFGGN